MTPKEAYEAKKSLRARLPNESFEEKRERDDAEMKLLLERFVSAIELIADACDRVANAKSVRG